MTTCPPLAVAGFSSRKTLALAAVCVATIVGGSAETLLASPVVLSTLGSPKEGPDSVDSNQVICQLFTTSSSAAGWYLTSVTIPLELRLTPSYFAVGVRSDVGSAPGAFIGEIGSPSSPPTGLQTFTADGPGLALDSNTNYWLIFAALGSYFIDYQTSLASEGPWSIPATGNTWGYSFNGGATWDLYDRSLTTFRFSLSAEPRSAVPEIDPAGIGSVLALVAGALGLLERRRSTVA